MRRLGIAVVLTTALIGGRVGAQTLPPLRDTLPPVPAAPTAKRTPVVEPLRNLPTGAPRAQGPLSLVILVDNKPEPTEPGVRRIDFREEATAPGYFSQYDGGSLLASIRARCATGEFQLESFHLYSRNNLTGELVASLDRRSDWRTPAQDTVVHKAVELGCGRRVQPASPVAVRAAAPASSATGAALRGPVGASPPPPTPSPSPSPSPQVATPRPAAPAPARAAGFSGALQVGAVPVEADARDILAKLRRAEPTRLSGLTGSVAKIETNGRTMYRALLTGFAARSDAVRLCTALAAKSQPCFVRD